MKTEKTQVNTCNFEKFNPATFLQLWPSAQQTLSPFPSLIFHSSFISLSFPMVAASSPLPVCRSIQPNTKAAGRSSVDQRKSMPLKKTEKRTIPLSLWWLNFLTSFQKALKCLEARGRNKLMVDGEHWTNFRALSCSRLRLKASSCLSSFKVLLPPAVSLKDLKRR